MDRGERRYRLERTRRRYAKLWHRWHRPRAVDGRLIASEFPAHRLYDAAELSRSLAHLVETHGRPCSCWGCKRH